MNNDYYAILGLTKSATTDEIKKAYRKLALQHHPDRGAGPASEKKFKEASEAYQVLSDPNKRAQYDRFGSAAFSGNGGVAGRQGNPGGFGGFDFSGFGGGQGDFSGFGFGGGLGDIFEEFFGSSMSQVQAEIHISAAQAVLGDKIMLEIDGQKLEFAIPAGVQSGSSFRFPGKGRTYRGNKKGDLIITVKIEMPKSLTKEQRELWEKLKESESKKKSWFGV
ncbi:MAG: DnaJ domain-containing protein [bacterium]